MTDLESVKTLLVAAGEEIGRLIDCLQDIEGLVRDLDPVLASAVRARIRQVLDHPMPT